MNVCCMPNMVHQFCTIVTFQLKLLTAIDGLQLNGFSAGDVKIEKKSVIFYQDTDYLNSFESWFGPGCWTAFIILADDQDPEKRIREVQVY